MKKHIDIYFLMASVILMSLAVLSLYWFGKSSAITIYPALVGCGFWLAYWVIKIKEGVK